MSEPGARDAEDNDEPLDWRAPSKDMLSYALVLIVRLRGRRGERHRRHRRHHHPSAHPGDFWHLAIAGAVIGFLTGIVVSTGPLSVPAFATYGLVKGAVIATEAAGSLALYISKAFTFRQFGALPTDIIVKGLISGSSVMAGTYTARLIVERLSVATFQHLLDGVMGIAGVALLWAALR